MMRSRVLSSFVARQSILATRQTPNSAFLLAHNLQQCAGFHSSVYRSKKTFQVPRLTLITKDETKKAVTRLSATPQLKPFAETIIKRREVFKAHAGVEKMERKADDGVHESVRQNICSGQVKLSFRETQKLCSLNKLGAKGTKDVLSKRLVTFFKRVAPERLDGMNYWELLNIRYNLDGDKDKECEANIREYEEEWKKKDQFEKDFIDKDSKRARSRIHFVADLAYNTKQKEQMAQQKEARALHNRVTGKFYASPAPTGRAKCRKCGEKIAKDIVRVTEHILFRKYHGKGFGGWTVGQMVRHCHAICFLGGDDYSASYAKDATLADIEDGDLLVLRDAIMKENEYWEKDKEWNHFLTGPVSLSYPGDTILFGYEDPDKIRTTAFRHDSGLLVVKSDRVAESNGPSEQ